MPQTSSIVFLDTETLGLELNAPIWEIAAIRVDLWEDAGRFRGAVIQKYQRFVRHDSQKGLHALPPEFQEDYFTRYSVREAGRSSEIGRDLQLLFLPQRGQKPRLAGAVPDFDTARLIHQGFAPEPPHTLWHYHLIDVEAMMVGYLAAHHVAIVPPWSSDELSALVGVDPKDYTRHTAAEDVRWAMDIYLKIMGISLEKG